MKILSKPFLAQRSLERSHTHSIFYDKGTEDDMVPGCEMFFFSSERVGNADDNDNDDKVNNDGDVDGKSY